MVNGFVGWARNEDVPFLFFNKKNDIENILGYTL